MWYTVYTTSGRWLDFRKEGFLVSLGSRGNVKVYVSGSSELARMAAVFGAVVRPYKEIGLLEIDDLSDEYYF